MSLILICDPDSAVRARLARQLPELGDFQVEALEGAAETRAWFQSASRLPDLLLLGHTLPPAEGRSLIASLREDQGFERLAFLGEPGSIKPPAWAASYPCLPGPPETAGRMAPFLRRLLGLPTAGETPEVPGHILLVAGDPDRRASLAAILREDQNRVSPAGNGEEALVLLGRHGFQLVATEPGPGGSWAFAILEHVRENTPHTPVVALMAPGEQGLAAELLQRGIHQLLDLPTQPLNLRLVARRALERAALDHASDYLRHEQPYIYQLDKIVAESEAMKRVMERVVKVAGSDLTVLIVGETGVGKNLVAGAIHFNSARRAKNLVTVNCAALADTLLESEMFGHERGAFTGAHKARSGRFEQAHGGSLFLDEVGDMSPALQAKLLRAIEEKVIQRVGGGRSITVDVRIISATNRELNRDVAQGGFRRDLYYRLGVATLEIPPLRERGSTSSPGRENTSPPGPGAPLPLPSAFAPGAAEPHRLFLPGNIRELRNVLERAMLFASGPELTSQDLGLGLAPAAFPSRPPPPPPPAPPPSPPPLTWPSWRTRPSRRPWWRATTCRRRPPGSWASPPAPFLQVGPPGVQASRPGLAPSPLRRPVTIWELQFRNTYALVNRIAFPAGPSQYQYQVTNRPSWATPHATRPGPAWHPICLLCGHRCINPRPRTRKGGSHVEHD